MKKRKILMSLIMAIMIFCSSIAFLIPTSAATVPVKVNYGNSEIANSLLINSVTYVPLRAFSNQMGIYNISWNSNTKTASVSTGGLALSAQVGRYYITANNRCFYTVESIVNINGSVYVPIRPLARAMGLDVTWDSATYSVGLRSNASGYVSSNAPYSYDNLYWLSRIINAEASSEPFLGKIAVGNVILNRMVSRDYPNTVYSVVFDKKFGTQFTPAVSGTIHNAPTSESIAAAKVCLEGYSLSSEIIFFFNPVIATNFWIAQARPYAMTVGNHDFYK